MEGGEGMLVVNEEVGGRHGSIIRAFINYVKRGLPERFFNLISS